MIFVIHILSGTKNLRYQLFILHYCSQLDKNKQINFGDLYALFSNSQYKEKPERLGCTLYNRKIPAMSVMMCTPNNKSNHLILEEVLMIPDTFQHKSHYCSSFWWDMKKSGQHRDQSILLAWYNSRPQKNTAYFISCQNHNRILSSLSHAGKIIMLIQSFLWLNLSNHSIV